MKRSSHLFATLALFAALLAPGAAHAQLAPMYNKLVNTVQNEVIKTLMAKVGLGVEGAVAQSGAQIQAEILKGAMIKQKNAEALEAYRQQQNLNRNALDIQQKLRSPALTCTAVAAQGGISNAIQSIPTRVASGQAATVKRLQGNTNTVQAIDSLHQATNKNFCTPAEAARGICSVNSANAALAGADQNAAFMFQAPDGSLTYASADQAAAADTFINRVVALVPQEQLRNVDYNTNPRARTYIELGRRLNSVLSMAAFSLRNVKEAHASISGLGTATNTASINQGGFASGKTDMAMTEAVQRYIALKFSPDNVRDAATATNENQILRDMAQTQAFQTWLEQQTMHQDSRTEALMAMQLAMLTESTLRPTLEAQRQAANNAARK